MSLQNSEAIKLQSAVGVRNNSSSVVQIHRRIGEAIRMQSNHMNAQYHLGLCSTQPASSLPLCPNIGLSFDFNRFTSAPKPLWASPYN